MQTTPQTILPFVRRHGPPGAAILLSLLAAVWVASAGTWVLLGPSLVQFTSSQVFYPQMNRYYDDQGKAILAGRLDVPCESIQPEAFVVEDRCYGYFGIAPSLLRIPLNLLFPRYYGQWETLSMLTASTGLLCLAYAMLLALLRLAFTTPSFPGTGDPRYLFLFLLVLGLGSPTIFLQSRTVLYHEAILWSCTFAAGCFFFLLRFLESRRTLWLLAAGGMALLAIHSRLLAGMAAVTACSLVPLLDSFSKRDLAPGKEKGSPFSFLRHKANWLGLAIGLLSVLSFYGIAYAKFGVFESNPLRYSSAYTPERQKVFGGKALHLENFFWNVDNYFGWHGPDIGVAKRRDTSPTAEARQRFPGAKIDDVEGFMSLPVGMTALLLLSLFGLWTLYRQGRHRLAFSVLLLCSLLGPAGLLFFIYLSYRYYHEYVLFFILAGGLGVIGLSTRPGNSLVNMVLTASASVNIVLNVLFSIENQINDTNLGPTIPPMLEKVKAIHSWLTAVSEALIALFRGG